MSKYLIIALLSCGGVFSIGWLVGYNHSQTRVFKDNYKQLKTLIGSVQSVDEKLNKNSIVQEEIKNQLTLSQKENTREVIQYVQKPVSNSYCIDDEWVQLYNKSYSSNISGSSVTSGVSGGLARNAKITK